MGRTVLKKKKVSEDGITDKMRRFAHEYVVEYNGKNAAIAAGYPAKSAGVMASKLLKNKWVAAEISRIELAIILKLGLTKERILQQLYYCATRSAEEFVDSDGMILPIPQLTVRARACIDGVKQKVRTWTDQHGEEHKEIETEYKLVGKASAVDMAMKHFGAYAPTVTENKLSMDWDSLYGPQKEKIVDPIEYRIQNPREEEPVPEIDTKQSLNDLIEEQE